jgi:hypothetical protein
VLLSPWIPTNGRVCRGNEGSVVKNTIFTILVLTLEGLRFFEKNSENAFSPESG